MLELNVSEGLEYCIDEELYLEVLQDYIDNDKRAILTEALNSQDMHRYAVEVHSVKSTSKTIGAGCLFDVAYQLEMAAKAEDVDTVRNNHASLMNDYSTILELVEEYIKENS